VPKGACQAPAVQQPLEAVASEAVVSVASEMVESTTGRARATGVVGRVKPPFMQASQSGETDLVLKM
jgi:hypothetical protein